MTSSSEESSSGEWLTPPFRLRTKSIAASTPAAARIPASWPAPDGSSTTARSCAAIAISHGLRRVAREPHRLDPIVGLEPDSGDQGVEPAGVRGPDVEAQPYSRRDDVGAPGLDLHLADRRHRAGYGERRLTDSQDLAGRRDEGVLATSHRRRPRVARVTLENELPARIAHDPGHDSDRHAGIREHGPLLDVELEKDARQHRSTRYERTTADTSDLLAAKDDHRPGSGALDGLERRHDAEGAVEATATRNAVQVRSSPDVVVTRGAPYDVAVGVELDSEPCLAHPAGGELARLVLGSTRMRPVRARAATEGIELVESVEDPQRSATPSSLFPICTDSSTYPSER